MFLPKQWVLFSSFVKMGTPTLLSRWASPFQVLKQVGKDACEAVLPETLKLHHDDAFHVSQLAAFYPCGYYQPSPPAKLLEGELEYEVDCTIDHEVMCSS